MSHSLLSLDFQYSQLIGHLLSNFTTQSPNKPPIQHHRKRFTPLTFGCCSTKWNHSIWREEPGKVTNRRGSVCDLTECSEMVEKTTGCSIWSVNRTDKSYKRRKRSCECGGEEKDSLSNWWWLDGHTDGEVHVGMMGEQIGAWLDKQGHEQIKEWLLDVTIPSPFCHPVKVKRGKGRLLETVMDGQEQIDKRTDLWWKIDSVLAYLWADIQMDKRTDRQIDRDRDWSTDS